MALYRDTGVVLRTWKLGEADRIVSVFTREHGKVRGVAKGVGAPVVSRVLAASYERQLSNRAIGRELDLDARAVGRIIAVGASRTRIDSTTCVRR